MSHETEFPAESKPADLSDDRERAVDELGRIAGAALRTPAPEHGVSAIRRRARNQRIVRAGAAVAGVLAVIAVGIAVGARRDESLQPGKDIPDNTVAVTELHDVNRQEAVPLARRALLTVDSGGGQWIDDQVWSDTEFPAQASATIAEMSECALLTSSGLFPPTTKSAGAFQHNNLEIQNVLVFATPEDASRAMDVVADAVFPKCWFNFWDRETAFDFAPATSTTEAWDAPEITEHGDRQMTVGQHTTTVNYAGGGIPPEAYYINTFIQVGRAITFVNPLYEATLREPLRSANNVTTAAATALTSVFGL